jgi:hypothetical protein
VPKHKKARRRLDPDEVLDGRSRPDAHELMALIHEVNPSGHDHLPARETARRYAQKSRLQSLLIRRFADDILVEPTDDPGVIGLRHRASDVDACHAVLASLDDDARSWAQRRLDLGGDDEDADEDVESARAFTLREEPRPHGPPSDAPLDVFSTDELLRRGRSALDAYDYLAARERFAAAFDRGREEAALPLLTVLVEHLGLDEDALGLEERLDAGTLKQAEVRLLLAQAAARGYQRDRAARLARDEAGDAAAEVFVALARGALGRGELDLAVADVAEVQRRAPSHPALLGLADTVKKRRAEERAPLEAEARRLLDEGRIGEAEARAVAIAARWPESSVAHGVARACQDERRREEGRGLAREGSAALADGETARAIGLLRRAMATGLSGEEAARAEQDLARAEVAEWARLELARAAEVARLLREGHVLRGLTDYLALDEVRRGHVQRLVGLAELVYLDETGVRGTGPDARSAAQAVMALRRALTMLTAGEAGADDVLLPHWPLLQAVPTAVKALDVAQQTTLLRRRAEALERYTAGMQAWKPTREGLAQSLKVLSTVQRDALEEDDRADLDRLVRRIRRMQERWDRAEQVGKLRDAGDLVGARDAVDELIRFEEAAARDHDPDDDLGDDRVDWHQKRADIVRDLAKSADVRISGAAGECLLGVEAPRLRDVPQSVLPGGHEILLAEAHGGRAFFQILDVASGRVVRRASLRSRTPFEVVRVQQRGDLAAVPGSNGMYFEIDPRSWDVGRAVSIGIDQGHAEQSVLAPGGRFAWGSLVMDGWWTAVTVYDLQRDTYGRTFSEACFEVSIRPLHGLDEPRVVVSRDRGTLTVHEARGVPIGPTHEELPALPRSVVVHPGGKGLFALMCEGDIYAGTRGTRWAELAPDGAPLRAPQGEDRTIAWLDPDRPCETAVALDARVVFVLGTTRSGARRLMGLAARGAGLERCFDVEVPPRLTLAQDGAARTVVALSPHEHGIEVVRLDATPPAFRVAPPATPPLELAGLNLAPLRPCAPPTLKLWSVSSGAAVSRLDIAYIQKVEGNERAAMIAQTLAPEDRPAVVPRHAALWKVHDPTFAEAFAAAALARYPDDLEMIQIPAQRSAFAGDWVAVRDRLGPVDPTPLGDAPAQHHDHLLGVALLMTGDVEGARRVLARGAARAGGWCDLAAPLALVGEASSCAGVGELDRAVRAADAALAAGDLGGARRALGGLVVREAREVQTLARLCRAWLEEPDETEEGGALIDGFGRRLSLAAFLAAHGEKSPTRRRELPFPGARWDREKLDALAAEATAWLEADLERPRPQG